MDSHLEKANRTAVDAGKAMIKLFDFAASVLEELSKGVEDSSGLKVGRYDRVRLSTQEARVIQRYTNSRNKGDSRVQRYVYSLFSPVERSEDPCFPFLLVSLVNVEGRPPCIVYGIVQKVEGRARTDREYCEYFLLWVNERINEICCPDHKKDYGWEARHELAGSAGDKRLTARVSLQTTGLFDITEETLSERAKTISQWFNDRLGLPAGTSATAR